MTEEVTTDTSGTRIVFQMEVESEADPISGVLRRGKRELPFVGWVALAGALERILDAPAEAGDGSEKNTTGRELPS